MFAGTSHQHEQNDDVEANGKSVGEKIAVHSQGERSHAERNRDEQRIDERAHHQPDQHGDAAKFACAPSVTQTRTATARAGEKLMRGNPGLAFSQSIRQANVLAICTMREAP